MKGELLKKLLVSRGIDLNEYDYYVNNTNYADIPTINISKKLLKEKLLKKYGSEMCNYLIKLVYEDEENVDPNKLLKFISDMKK